MRALTLSVLLLAGTAEAQPVFDLPALHLRAEMGDPEAAESLRHWQRETAQEAAVVSGGDAPIEEANTGWDAMSGVLTPEFRFAPILARREVTTREGPVWTALRRRVARGEAAGLAGILYDNRDEGHSTLKAEDWPQLAFTRYGEAAHAAGLHRGVNRFFRFGAPVIGNASVAITTGLWRSMPRLAMTSPGGATALYRLFSANHLYVFPEHNDHDPEAENGRGDMLPANQPYVLISQGSSYSDKPLIEAALAIVASLRPETRAKAEAEGLLPATVQMVIRQGLTGVEGRDDYLGPMAHPSVIPAERIDLSRMLEISADLPADGLAPIPYLSVAAPLVRTVNDGLDAGLGEVVFATPHAYAFAFRDAAFTRRVVASAALTKDPNGLPLTYHWRVIRGDPERITVAPRDESGTIADIEVAWHERMPVPASPGISSNRVDIAVFADNGETLSAPAFLSWLFPGDQDRVYEKIAGETRLVSVEHRVSRERDWMTDPVIFADRDWKDSYAYDGDGRLSGWVRDYGGRTSAFDADGRRIVEGDGEEVRTEEVGYEVEMKGNRSHLRETAVEAAPAEE